MVLEGDKKKELGRASCVRGSPGNAERLWFEGNREDPRW